MTRRDRPPVDLSPADWCVLAACAIVIALICWCGWMLFVPVTP